MFIYIELTSRCNLRCVHCYNSSGPARHAIRLRAARRLLDSAKVVGGLDVQFGGGEPFLYQQLREVLEAADMLGLRTQIVTNGTVISRTVLECCRQMQTGIQVSMDGYDAATHDRVRGPGVYGRVLRFLDVVVREMGAPDLLSLRCLVSATTVGSLGRYAELASRYRIPRLFFAWPQYAGRARQSGAYWDLCLSGYQQREALHEARSLRGTCDGSVRIDPLGLPGGTCQIYDGQIAGAIRVACNGDVFPCQGMTRRRHRIGNMHTEPLEVILRNSVWPHVAESTRALLAACGHCALERLCVKGCPAMGEYQEETGLTDLDTFCGARRLACRDVLRARRTASLERERWRQEAAMGSGASRGTEVRRKQPHVE